MTINRDMTNKDYHAHPALSKTQLDWLNQSPAHYQCYLKEPPQATPAMVKGAAFHTAVLQPDQWGKQYKVYGGRKYGKQWDEFKANCGPDQEVITRDDEIAIAGMVKAVRQHPAAALILDQAGLVEASVFADFGGIKVKARPDLWVDSLVVDLKSTVSAAPDDFKKSIFNYRYHVQGSFYLDVIAKATGEDPDLAKRQFVLVAVEKEPPYAVAVYRLTPEVIEAGREAYWRNLETYRRCMETGLWPAYSDYIEDIGLPLWARKQGGVFYE